MMQFDFNLRKLSTLILTFFAVLIGGGDDDSKYPTSILFSNKVGDLNDLDIYSRVRRQQSIYFLRFDEIVDGIERNISLMFDTW